MLVPLKRLDGPVEWSTREPLSPDILVPTIFFFVLGSYSEIDKDHTVSHDPIVIQLNVLVNEAVAMHLFDCLNHLDEDVSEGQLVWDATNVKVLLN